MEGYLTAEGKHWHGTLKKPGTVLLAGMSVRDLEHRITQVGGINWQKHFLKNILSARSVKGMEGCGLRSVWTILTLGPSVRTISLSVVTFRRCATSATSTRGIRIRLGFRNGKELISNEKV